jgi:F-type H+-transporting ATPase subunit b
VQFKHSSSVQLLARITGLSLEGAYWLAVILNFVIIAGLIVWASKKNLPAMFRNRTASIQKSLEEARKASEDANRRLSDVESRLSRLGDEINQMRATSEKEAAADEDARRIIESAGQEITAATRAARRELTAHAADLAVTLASKQIHVDTATDQALVRRFAQQISNGTTGKKT